LEVMPDSELLPHHRHHHHHHHHYGHRSPAVGL